MSQRIITIGNNEILAEEKELRQADLFFYSKNPRIYTILKDLGDSPSQIDIENKMRSRDHVKTLKESIKANGGLLEPIIVCKNIVLEGNSRLAAYRILASEDPVRWGKIKCNVLPDDTNDDVITSLLGTLHIIGKTPWSPFEQAGFLVRRIQTSRKPIDAIAKELGIKKSDIKLYTDVYLTMESMDDMNPTKWSYYFELLKNRDIKKYDDNNPSMHYINSILEFIKDNKIEEAKDIRKYAILAKTDNENSNDAIELVLNEEIKLDEAVDLVSVDTKIASLCKKVETFYDYLKKEEVNFKANSKDEHLNYYMKQVSTLLHSILNRNEN